MAYDVGGVVSGICVDPARRKSGGDGYHHQKSAYCMALHRNLARGGIPFRFVGSDTLSSDCRREVLHRALFEQDTSAGTSLHVSFDPAHLGNFCD